MHSIVLTFQSYRWISSKVVTATMGSLILLLLWKFILPYQWIPLFVYNCIQAYDSVFEFVSSLSHVFHGSFPVLFPSALAVLGTNIKQKIRAVSCTIRGHSIHRFLLLISQLLLFSYLHKDKLLTRHKEESTCYFQRRRENSKKHGYNGGTQGVPVLCQNIGIDQNSKKWPSRLQSHPTHRRFACISE